MSAAQTITRIKKILAEGEPGQTVNVRGWVRTRRSKPEFSFIEVHDGSCFSGLQIVIDADAAGYEHIKEVSTGASISVTGELKESPGKGQSVELHGKELVLLGTADPETYPLQKKRHSFEFLREIAHLRPRTNTFGAVARIRHAAAFAIHDFFTQHGFFWVNTPIVTASDAEGAGDMFRVGDQLFRVQGV